MAALGFRAFAALSPEIILTYPNPEIIQNKHFLVENSLNLGHVQN